MEPMCVREVSSACVEEVLARGFFAGAERRPLSEIDEDNACVRVRLPRLSLRA